MIMIQIIEHNIVSQTMCVDGYTMRQREKREKKGRKNI